MKPEHNSQYKQYKNSKNKSVFSFLRQLSSTLTVRICCCVPCCGAVAVGRRRLLHGYRQPLSIGISCLRGAQQQTRRTLLQRSISGTRRRVDRWTNRRTP